MKVRLKVQITGTRNGVPWPEYGEVIDLPEDEARDMIAADLASALTKSQDSEEAVSAPAAAREALVPKRKVRGRGR